MKLPAPEEVNVPMLPSLPLERRNDLPNTAAIYFVVSGEDDILYVGRTTKLAIRFLAHDKLGYFKKFAQVRVAYLSITDISLLPAIEQAMITYFDPPLNRQGKASGGIPTMVRLPERLHLLCRVQAAQARRSISAQLVLIVEDWANEMKDKAFLSQPAPDGREGDESRVPVAIGK